MKHELKLRIEYADAVNSGMKSFEIRKDDRGYQRGDTVKFKVIDGNGNHIEHPVEEKKFMINYVLHGWGLEQNWCAFSIRKKPVIKEAPDPEFQMPNLNPADFGTSPILETMRKMAYDRMPVKLGQKLFSIFFNDDMRAWSVRYEPVTGVCFDGFRVSSSPARLPSDSSVLFDWDTIGKEVFLTTEEATREALRRTREGIRP